MLCLAILASTASATSRPALRVTTTSPLVVVGSGFVSGERVTVTALTTVRRRRVLTTANAKGRIKVSLGAVTQPCATPFAVRAVGAKSGAALARVVGRPCVPPPID